MVSLVSEEQGGPVLGPTLAEWLKARDETRHHLRSAAPPVDQAWVQRLADLLATERSWQDQYTELVALGSQDRRFPPSNR
jgi:hypothetical protein